MSLLRQVFVINAAVLTAAMVALVVSPLTVSFPVALTEWGCWQPGWWDC